ncbi:hypothetical protein CC80DRAFT_537385 [Byssothecium circinans]|uniref:F-box domain-containing protein n=1 Tax=Byssothecium circinans TaxID=147558 RepID=A0A6A5TLC9_9PLEO|nr:hypothetical protein CC80DRAFT_537385 [Byssothecium circinans]
MSLLSLPPELIRDILHNLDPTSFYNCLQTAKIFRQHALASTSLLHDQLARIPGQRILSDSIRRDAKALIKLFGKRATQHLFHDVARTADVHVWEAERCVDRKLSGILRWTWLEYNWGRIRLPAQVKATEDTLLLCEVKEKAGLINLYGIREGSPRLEHCISTDQFSRYLYPPSENVPTEYKIFKIAPLYAFDDVLNPCLQIALLYGPNHDSRDEESMPWKLFHLALDPKLQGARILNIYTIVPHDGDVFMDMAFAVDGRPIIAWSSSKSDPYPSLCFHHRVTIYSKEGFDDDPLSTNHHSVKLTMLSTLEADKPLLNLTKISVAGRYVHLLAADSTIPALTTKLLADRTLTEFSRRVPHLPNILEAFPGRTLAPSPLAIHHHHSVQIADLNNGNPTCVNTALQLAITRAGRFDPRKRKGAFLIKSLQYPNECHPWALTEDYPNLNHVFVAELAGLPDLYNLSSLGLVVATSPHAHRIAIASWRTLLIYSLDPRAFLDPVFSLSQLVPTTHDTDNADKDKRAGVPGDYAFIEGCGWQFYGNCGRRGECVVLEPVRVECRGVVYGLEWGGEEGFV